MIRSSYRASSVRRAAAVFAITSAAMLTLASCASEPVEIDPPITEHAPVVPESTEPESADVEPQVVGTILPSSCAEILPSGVYRTYDPRIELHSEGAMAEGWVARLLGPLTMETLKGGDQQLFCGWGIPQTDGGAYLGVAVVSQDSKQELLEALRSSVYVKEEPGAAEAVFTRGPSVDHQHNARIIIDDDLLIAAGHTVAGTFAQDVLANVRS